MIFKEKIEEKVQKTEKKLAELSLTMERLDREYQQLLEEIAMTPEQIKNYVETPSNFSPPIWEQLQNEKKKLDEKLNLELNAIPDLTMTKKTFSEKATIQQHWLFVR